MARCGLGQRNAGGWWNEGQMRADAPSDEADRGETNCGTTTPHRSARTVRRAACASTATIASLICSSVVALRQ